ncbi:MAG: hypothetical protein MUE40_03900 [Anaerolineae bacterium]|jgi:hypothetical protein|nr:hypothetical protein [Anaerolineae bacterium]
MMRYLHPVAAGEQFLAGGVYQRYAGAQRLAMTETWTMHRTGGARLTRLDQDARATEGWSALAEVLHSPQGRIERLNVLLLYARPDAPVRQMKLDYSFLETYVQMTRRIDRQEPEYSELPLPAPALFVRLLEFNLFWGEALHAATADPAPAAIFVPFRRPQHPPGQFVGAGALPTIADQSAQRLRLGRQEYAVRRYRTTGDRVIDVDERGIPLSIHQARSHLTDVLTDYARA